MSYQRDAVQKMLELTTGIYKSTANRSLVTLDVNLRIFLSFVWEFRGQFMTASPKHGDKIEVDFDVRIRYDSSLDP